MGSWLVFLALFLFTALATVAKAESPHDIQNNAELVHRLAYSSDIVAFKMGRRQGARRAHI